jgi:Family of unknown function (DUF6049)
MNLSPVCRALAAAALVVPATAVEALAPAAADPAVPVAASATSATDLTVQLTSVSPAVVTPGAPVVVDGVVRNEGATAVTAPTVRAVLGTMEATRPAVRAWAQATGPAQGAVVGTVRASSAVPPGGTAAFRLRLTGLAERGLTTYGALPLSIEVDGSSVRTFAGYQRLKQYVPVSIAWAVPLTLDPDPNLFGATGDTRETAWAQALDPTARLHRVIDATEDAPVTWAVDPTLTPGLLPDPVDTGAPGSRERTLRTTTQSRIATLAGSHGPWVLPDTDADLAAVAGQESAQGLMRGLVERSAEVAESLGGRADIAWPADGAYTTPREAALRRLFRVPALAGQVTSASTRATTVEGATPGAVQRSQSGLALLAYDDALSALLARTTTGPEAVLSAQQFVAESAALLNELPGTTGRSVLVAAPRSFNPDPQAAARFLTTVGAIPWLTPQTTDQQLTAARRALPSAAAAPVTRPTVAPASPPPVLTAARIRQLEATVRTVRGVAQIRDDGEAFAGTWTRAAEQLASTRWRTAPTTWNTLSGRVQAAAAQTTTAVKVSASTVNFLADSGRLQITVTNALDVPVENVKLTVEASRPLLRIDSQPAVLRIGPRSQTTVNVSVTAVAAGAVPLRTTLTTPDGTIVGQGADVQVRVTPTGSWIYWALGGVAGIVIALGIVRSMRQRPRNRLLSAPPAGPLP